MTRTQARSLARAFLKKFGGKAEFETIAPGRYRFAVVSKKFNDMSHFKRQDQAWELVDELLPREATLDVSSILLFAPKDLVPQPAKKFRPYREVVR